MISGQATKSTARKIVGNLASPQRLAGSISQETVIAGNLASAYTTQGSPYEGDYDVMPTVEGQALQTKHKFMKDDITILAIPFYEVSNPSGGNTVYIADEIEKE